jgi:ferredoxin-NADP reductase
VSATVQPRLAWRTATIIELKVETAHAKTLVLDVPDWPGHLPGQHVDVRLTAEDGYQAQRSYSIASGPESDRLELTIERIEEGEVSTYLVDGAEAGDEFELRGPIGGYFAWHVRLGGPLVLVGGGSGLVPLLAMLRHRRAVGSQVDARLLVSARSFDDLLYRDELRELRDSGVPILLTLTRSTAPAAWPDALRGRINGEMLTQLGPEPGAGARFYVCGPTPFVEEAARLLVELSHDPRAVRTERFGPTGA